MNYFSLRTLSERKKTRPFWVSGFTVLELLVVLAIIGILSSIVLMSVSSARNQAKDVRVRANVRSLRDLVETSHNGSYYADITPNDTSYNNGDDHFGSAYSSGPDYQALRYIKTENVNLGSDSFFSIKSRNASPYQAVSYAVYGRLITNPAKYFCLDSNGGSNAATSTYLNSVCGQ